MERDSARAVHSCNRHCLVSIDTMMEQRKNGVAAALRRHRALISVPGFCVFVGMRTPAKKQ